VTSVTAGDEAANVAAKPGASVMLVLETWITPQSHRNQWHSSTRKRPDNSYPLIRPLTFMTGPFPSRWLKFH